MTPIETFFLSFISTWAIVSLLSFYLSKKLGKENISLIPGILFMLKSIKLGASLSNRIRTRRTLEEKLLGVIFILIGIWAMFTGLTSLLLNLIVGLTKPSSMAPVVPLVPGITVSLESLPQFIVSAMITIIVHESAHAIAALLAGVKIRSVGFILLTPMIPGGFVELDEKSIADKDIFQKISIFSAGSASNIVLGQLFSLVLTNALLFQSMLFPFMVKGEGVLVVSTVKGSPAEDVIKKGDVIIAINGTPILSQSDLFSFMENVTPNSFLNITLVRNGSTVTVPLTTVAHPSIRNRGFIGVVIFDYYKPRSWCSSFMDSFSAVSIFQLVAWIVFININVGILNMLPIPALDGDRFIKSILEKVRHGDKLLNAIRAFALTLVALNILLTVLLGKLISL